MWISRPEYVNLGTFQGWQVAIGHTVTGEVITDSRSAIIGDWQVAFEIGGELCEVKACDSIRFRAAA